MYFRTQLNNGLKIVTSRMANMQSIALGIWIKTGGRYENSGLKGIAHYLEHLLFKGSKKYSCRRIKESIEGLGGSLNGFTSEELTCYLVKIPRNYLSLALDILSDMVLNPKLLRQDVDKERTVILEEVKMYKDLPQSYVHELLDELMWPGQPLGLAIAGSQESVNRITREDLFAFQKKYYTASKIVVSAAGALDNCALVKKIEHNFCRDKLSAETNFLAAEKRQNRPRLKLLGKDTQQTHLAMGFHALQRGHPLRHALSLLNIVLGANMSSRLFNEIREKRGLAYEIGTQVKRFSDTGAFLVHAGIDNRKVVETVNLALKELKKIKNTLISLDEFRRAKEFYLGQLMLALEDTLDHMLWVGESIATLDKAYSLREIVGEVERLKREDVRRVADYVFREDNLNLALIGPIRKQEEKIYAALGLN